MPAENIDLTANFEEEPDPAYFEVEMTSPEDGAEYEEGAEVTVEYTVHNTGEVEGTQDIIFSVEGAEVEVEENITLGVGADYFGEFTWTAEEIGEYDLEVASEDTSDNVTITIKEDVTHYQLTIDIVGQGSTDPSEGTHTFEEGTEVTVTATPDEGWEFDRWTGDHEGTDEEITITMDSDKSITAHFETVIEEYDLTIVVIDEDDYPVEGANVTVDGETQETDENGEVVFEDLVPDTYNYTVEKEDYETVKDEIEIVDDDVTEEVILEEIIEYHDLTIAVIDGEGEPVEGALVDVEGELDETEENGEVVFEDLEPDTYNYTVEKEGYETVGDEVEIIDDDVTEEVILEEIIEYHDLTILVTDEEYEPIVGAEVELNSTETEEIDYVEITDENGVAMFEDIPEANYEYVVTHADHLAEEGMIELKEDLEEDIVLQDAMILELEIRGSGTVDWTFDPEPVYENEVEPGEWEFKLENETIVELLPEPEKGWMFYEWEDLGEEYDQKTGATDFIITEDKDTTLVFVEEDEYHTLNIGATWGEGTVEVDGEEIEVPFERMYENGTEVKLSAIPEEDHEFVGWFERIDTDEYEPFAEESDITVSMERDITLIPEFAELVIELNVIGEGEITVEARMDEDEEWVEHPDSPITDEGVISGEPGLEVRLTAEAAEGYEFVEWDGYPEDEKEITFILEEDMDITAVFEEEEEYYDLTIGVEDEDQEPIEDATVILDGTEEITTEEGIVVFEDLEPDTYVYEVTKEDHETIEGEVIIEDDVTEEVTLEKLEEGQLKVEILEVDTEVEEDEQIRIEYRVENTGETKITETIKIVIYRNDDGEQNLMLTAAENDEIVFEYEKTYELEGGASDGNEVTTEIEETGDYRLSVTGSNHDEALDLPDELDISVEESDDEMDWTIPGIILVIVIVVLVILVFFMKSGMTGEVTERTEEPGMEVKSEEPEEETVEEEEMFGEEEIVDEEDTGDELPAEDEDAEEIEDVEEDEEGSSDLE